MKRSDCLGLMKAAGYHGDKATFARLLIENRVSRMAAEAAFRIGAKAKTDGARCGCSDCNMTGAEFVAAAQAIIEPRSDEEIREAIAEIEGR